jgi:hypothetical protein
MLLFLAIIIWSISWMIITFFFAVVGNSLRFGPGVVDGTNDEPPCSRVSVL